MKVIDKALKRVSWDKKELKEVFQAYYDYDQKKNSRPRQYVVSGINLDKARAVVHINGGYYRDSIYGKLLEGDKKMMVLSGDELNKALCIGFAIQNKLRMVIIKDIFIDNFDIQFNSSEMLGVLMAKGSAGR
jgi:hypothetical protein